MKDDLDVVIRAIHDDPESGAKVIGEMDIDRGHRLMIRLLVWCVAQILRVPTKDDN